MAESRVDVKAERQATRQVARLVRRIGAFGRGHGEVEAQVAYLGRRGARIVLVAADGTWGDLVAPTYDLGRRALADAGVTVHDDFGPELASRMRTGPYEWSRMAGNQIGGRANT